MPREQIQYPRPGRVLASLEGGKETYSEETAPQFPLLHIGWHNDPDGGGWVQAHLQIDKLFFAQWVKDMQATADQHDDGTIDLYSETMTRDECNQLIKQTRRARDGAYGADA